MAEKNECEGRDLLWREFRAWGATIVEALAEKVRAELKQYEHPLFVFDARAAAEGVEVLIHFSPPEPQVHTYIFLMRPREIESKQFPWIFQKQLYDCLHDFVVEMFTCNPQRQDA